MISPHIIELLIHLEKHATPGPWAYDYTWTNHVPTADFFVPGLNIGQHIELLAQDADFIAASRIWMGPLLQLVEELNQRIAELEDKNKDTK